jgi:SAM-dependent methyltransferase
MGIDIEAARFLLASRQDGASFQRCATLGRQNYFLGNQETAALLREFGLTPEYCPKLFSEKYSRFRYSEAFWEMMGAQEVEIVDASDFEGGAHTHVHDLNLPIADHLKERFDAVCDFGTLEHVFNFPIAIRNCLEMVKPGGRFIAQTPANNYFGHGFYQFSPELFFRILTDKNGFQLEIMIAVEYGPRRRWFAVADPESIKARVSLTNSFPVMLFVRARKTGKLPTVMTAPQQSDCVAMWTQQASPAQKGVIDRFASPKLIRLKQALLETTPRLARVLEALRFSPLNRELSFRNRLSFSPINKRKLGKRM